MRNFTTAQPRPNASLASTAYSKMKHDIITGAFRAGQALSENALAQHYAISRTPIREAAARLLQENLLHLVPNKGYFVTLPKVHELGELYQYRGILEGASAQLAAHKGLEEEQLNFLNEKASCQYRRGDRASYIKFISNDTAFHVGIAEASGNRLLVRAVADLRCQIERLLYATIDIGDYGAMLSREHANILKAIKSKKPPLAKKLMLEHVSKSRAKVLQLL